VILNGLFGRILECLLHRALAEEDHQQRQPILHVTRVHPRTSPTDLAVVADRVRCFAANCCGQAEPAFTRELNLTELVRIMRCST